MWVTGIPAGKVATTVLHVGGLGWASEKAVVERVLGRRPGVRLVAANPVAQTATVTCDTGQTSVADLRRWVQECRFHCAGQSVPSHVCQILPRAEPAVPVGGEAALAVPAARPGDEDGAAPADRAPGVAEVPPAHAGPETRPWHRPSRLRTR